MKKPLSLLIFTLLLFRGQIVAQQPLVSAVQRIALNSLSSNFNSQFRNGRQRALTLAKTKGWIVSHKTRNGGMLALQGVNSLGFPVYFITHDNIISAATTGTNTVQPGGFGP